MRKKRRIQINKPINLKSFITENPELELFHTPSEISSKNFDIDNMRKIYGMLTQKEKINIYRNSFPVYLENKIQSLTRKD